MFLLDTNVISEIRKVRAGRADPNVGHWADSVDTSELFISVVTLEEIQIGTLLAEQRGDAGQGQVLRTWLDEHLLPSFADRILPIDAAVARQSAKFHVPDPKPVRDAYIAATAVVHGLDVVTRNVRDFDGMGLILINPWTPQ